MVSEFQSNICRRWCLPYTLWPMPLRYSYKAPTFPFAVAYTVIGQRLNACLLVFGQRDVTLCSTKRSFDLLFEKFIAQNWSSMHIATKKTTDWFGYATNTTEQLIIFWTLFCYLLLAVQQQHTWWYIDKNIECLSIKI